ncbi:hypothetical protein [uncultured Bacteroides sp.]|uniref:hypothetical protein n=1 Tax=uncultured Bacteroides sp. TaxID=162156 RepID=UPI0026161CED|nr:hypothetical protein [uncultured Bacteroides sp.]
METKTVTIRIPEDVEKYLTRNGDKINPEVISTVRRLKRIREVAMAELKGVFTENEWSFIFDLTKGLIIDDNFSSSKGVLIAQIEDSEKYDGLATRHFADVSKMMEKIKTLHGSNIDAIYERAAAFWSQHNDIKEWCKF